ncbi:hypothetical protein PROFUN_00116 [Planoprotostelium fungivorum]|uniref:Uncharacterized protein n=1 Tax=Planoprotostelium fungivorum TaxID=1890364 RepID=A0A2P6P0P9_9EUKA|nr:hypothetical protein PROFUN_00116 [Planoprotostelium fungivorum]
MLSVLSNGVLKVEGRTIGAQLDPTLPHLEEPSPVVSPTNDKRGKTHEKLPTIEEEEGD